MASFFKPNFAELYRSAFAENDPETKQVLLQEVQACIDSWHFREQHFDQQKKHGASIEPPSPAPPLSS